MQSGIEWDGVGMVIEPTVEARRDVYVRRGKLGRKRKLLLQAAGSRVLIRRRLVDWSLSLECCFMINTYVRGLHAT